MRHRDMQDACRILGSAKCAWRASDAKQIKATIFSSKPLTDNNGKQKLHHSDVLPIA